MRNITFQERIIDLLDKNNMTRKDLAEKTSVSSAAISNYLKKGQIPSATIVGEIAKAFNVSIDYLVFGHEEYADYIEKQLIECFRELNSDNKLKVVKEATGLRAVQSLEEQNKRD